MGIIYVEGGVGLPTRTPTDRIVRRRNGCDAPLDAFGISEGTGMDMSAIRARRPTSVHITHGSETGSPFALLTSMANTLSCLKISTPTGMLMLNQWILFVMHSKGYCITA